VADEDGIVNVGMALIDDSLFVGVATVLSLVVLLLLLNVFLIPPANSSKHSAMDVLFLIESCGCCLLLLVLHGCFLLS